MKRRGFILFGALCAIAACLVGCGTTNEEVDETTPPDDSITAHTDVSFTYDNEENLEEASDNLLEGAYTNYDELLENLHINPVEGLEDRDDFAFGVDASMIYAIEQAGGVYYNEEGYEQDIFTLLKKGGANYFRVRLWNDPNYQGSITYGGGGNSLDVDIELAKRAQEVGMNILVDFHYSDFWADPDYQVVPKDWDDLSYDELIDEVETFSYDCIEAFNEAGVKVNAVQIGNEINNGILEGYGDIDWADMDESFRKVSEILTSGIRGVRRADNDIYTIIHLANGGSRDEFETFFTYLEEYDVPYDIIGASYYPYYHGSLDLLAENLNNCAETFNKPVMVMETSYGYTDDESNEWVGNTYNSGYEDDGGFITSTQGQMTCLRDVVETVCDVPNDLGLGVFYWEPTWIPVEPIVDDYGITEVSAGWATEYGLCYKNYDNNLNLLDSIKNNETNNINKSTWANQGWFTYDGQALPSLYTYSFLKEGLNPIEEIPLKYRDDSVSYTYNRADETDSLPSTVKVETNLDAIRDYSITWNDRNLDLTTDGTSYITGAINWGSNQPTDGNTTITLVVTVIQNFIVDPGFEKQAETSTSDNLGGDWTIYSTSPNGEKVVKLNRKPVDVRTGTTDVNFYYTSEYSFNFGQEVTLEAGDYSLTSYLMGINMSSYEGSVEMYVLIDGEYQTVDGTSLMTGWASWYRSLSLDFTLDSQTTVTVGYIGEDLSADVWGHIDDFELVAK